MSKPTIDEILDALVPTATVLPDSDTDAEKAELLTRLINNRKVVAKAALEQYVIRELIAELKTIDNPDNVYVYDYGLISVTDRIKTLQAKLIKEKEL